MTQLSSAPTGQFFRLILSALFLVFLYSCKKDFKQDVSVPKLRQFKTRFYFYF
jgi:hypothetical protein